MNLPVLSCSRRALYRLVDTAPDYPVVAPPTDTISHVASCALWTEFHTSGYLVLVILQFISCVSLQDKMFITLNCYSYIGVCVLFVVSYLRRTMHTYVCIVANTSSTVRLSLSCSTDFLIPHSLLYCPVSSSNCWSLFSISDRARDSAGTNLCCWRRKHRATLLAHHCVSSW